MIRAPDLKICPKCGNSFVRFKTVFPPAFSKSGITQRVFFHKTGFKAQGCVVTVAHPKKDALTR